MKAILLLLFIAAGLACPPGSNAGLMEPLPISQLASNADVIVHGTVVAKTVERDPEGRIFTRLKLQLTEVWKGAVNPAEFSIVHGGGRIGNEESRASIQVHYEIGEEVVAMLRLNQRKEGVTLGLVQGKFAVETDPADGVKIVSNVFHGRGKDAGRNPAAAARARLTLEDFKQQVKGGRS